jgi:pimeloyl-ACP methyl ester carboxylesterase
MVTPVCDPDVRSQVERWMRATGKAGAVGALRALLDRPDSVPTLSKIDVPVLLVCGDQDPISPPQEMEGLAREIKGSTFVKIESAAHLSNVEQPEAFNEAVLTWLGRL